MTTTYPAVIHVPYSPEFCSYIQEVKSCFIENLRRAAKDEKRASGSNPYMFYLNRIASGAGFQNWNLLDKKLKNIRPDKFIELRNIVNSGIAKASQIQLKSM